MKTYEQFIEYLSEKHINMRQQEIRAYEVVRGGCDAFLELEEGGSVLVLVLNLPDDFFVACLRMLPIWVRSGKLTAAESKSRRW